MYASLKASLDYVRRAYIKFQPSAGQIPGKAIGVVCNGTAGPYTGGIRGGSNKPPFWQANCDIKV